MKPQPTHTPTPWFFTEENFEGLNSIREKEHGLRVAQARSEANAAFIVRAVNAHDALVSVIREMKDMIASKNTLSKWEDNWLAAAVAAIAKAEGRV